MSLRRRLLLYLLICAPVVWLLALAGSFFQARTEVNELFDTEMIRLTRQVQLTLTRVGAGADTRAESEMPAPMVDGQADLDSLAIVVWDRDGQVVLADREGAQLPLRSDGAGFIDLDIQQESWRVYYLQSADGRWLVAAGQNLYERDELVYGLIGSQLLPWLLMLPILLIAMGWAVRQALAPMRALSDELGRRGADELQPLPAREAPVELRPLLEAMNGLFDRIAATLARERRFTADAAHELRTPLAVLSAQWDRLHGARADAERDQAMQALRAGIERMARLVDQLLRLSRLEAAQGLPQTGELDWPEIARQAMSDVLPLAERRQIQLDCLWPEPPQGPPQWLGDPNLIVVLLRNLLDNATRYAPEGSTVSLGFEVDRLRVDNAGPALSAELLERLGERFHRPEGQAESGSGLGVSIARRIAELHGLSLSYGARADGTGVEVVLARA
ncbi:histidine kinase [Hylemonella gracilis str. Niagara R]|uniref:histidine kinase n=1 Tax=Hylemonella gracilis str. Niagara R TaxID=1458275 RepID=A0A016XJQ7_9BURK|nr:ATP-binding protein [Hylemonella gracilis]EYC52344.1 histidine kinase [Hylemonella gracilis str. Niagara R]